MARGKRAKCPNCGRSLKNRKAVERHMAEHAEERDSAARKKAGDG